MMLSRIKRSRAGAWLPAAGLLAAVVALGAVLIGSDRAAAESVECRNGHWAVVDGDYIIQHSSLDSSEARPTYKYDPHNIGTVLFNPLRPEIVHRPDFPDGYVGPPSRALPGPSSPRYSVAWTQLVGTGWLLYANFMISHPDYRNGAAFFPYTYNPATCPGGSNLGPGFARQDGTCIYGYNFNGLLVDIELNGVTVGGLNALTCTITDPTFEWNDTARNSRYTERGAFVFQCDDG